MIKQGTIVKSVGGVFTVIDNNGDKTVCYSPKKFRYNANDIIIGDIVKFEDLKRGKGLIVEVNPRKNKLARPEVANVDVCLIVVACEPQPDYYLVDKVLINCFQQGIEPVIVVNKTDLTTETYNEVVLNFSKVAEIAAVSALDGSACNLNKYFVDGQVICFAGQSAVGKTSLLNSLIPSVDGQVGGLSQKSGRGMHTTRHATLHRMQSGFIVDTCGFSLCDIKNIRPDELRLYLDDMVNLSHNCKYPSCTHTAEPNCAVKNAVDSGQFNRDRYNRYVEEYNELVEFEKNKY